MPDIEILLTMTASVRHKGGTSAKTRAVTKTTTLAGPRPGLALKILAQEGVDELVPYVEDDLEELIEDNRKPDCPYKHHAADCDCKGMGGDR